MRTIIISNESTILKDEDVQVCVNALQIQIDIDFSPVYNLWAYLQFLAGKPICNKEIIHLLDNSEQAQAEGYHDLSSKDVPEGFAFVKDTLDAGDTWQTTLSHELLEQLLDPWVDLLVPGPINNTPACIAYEVADPVEQDFYLINNIPVSNFVLPQWFNGELKNLDFMNNIKVADKPFPMTKGGYIAYTTDIVNYLDIYAESGKRPRLAKTKFSW